MEKVTVDIFFTVDTYSKIKFPGPVAPTRNRLIKYDIGLVLKLRNKFY